MNSCLEKRDYIIIILSTLLLIDGVDNIVEYTLSFILSLCLLKKPEGYIPLVWVSSWFSKMVVLPFLGAFFYYLLLFIVSSVYFSRFGSVYDGSRNVQRALSVFAVWLLSTLFTSLSPEYDLVIKVVIYVLSVIIIYKYKGINMKDLTQIIIFISVVASVFFSLRITFFPVIFTIEDIHEWGVFSLSSMTLMPHLNPNTAAQIIVLLSIVIICSLFKYKKIILLTPLMLNLYTLLQLGSRTSFFTLIIVTSLYFILISKLSILRKIILATTFAIIYFIFSFYIDAIFSASRIANESIFDDDGSGRFVTWTLLLSNVLPNHWISGIGLGRNGYEKLGFQFDADNLYVDLLCQIGIVGFMLFFYIYFIVVLKSYRRLKNLANYPDFLFMFMVSVLFLGIGETLFDTTLFWSTIFLVSLGNLNEYFVINLSKTNITKKRI